MFVQLEAFLTHRVSEMGEDGGVIAMSQFQLAPVIIQDQSQENTRQMLSEVKDLLGRLTSLRMQHLFMIQASPRYAHPHSLRHYKWWFSKCVNKQYLMQQSGNLRL